MSTTNICAKCNAVLEDGAEFCQECGTKIEAAPEIVCEDIFCPECGAKTTAESDFCPECGKPISTQEKNKSAAPAKAGSKKVKLPGKPLLLGIISAVVLIAVGVGVFMNSGGSKDANHFVYAKDKEFQFAYLSNSKPFQLTDRLYDKSVALDAGDFVFFTAAILMSDDEKYIFYPDRVDDSGTTYYWRDTKSNSKDSTATKIDSEICELPCLTADGGKFFYIKGYAEQRLYVFDRKTGEKNKLDDDVVSFTINKAGDYLIYNTYRDGEYTLYEMTLKGTTGEKTKLDSNSEILEVFANEKKVYYQKDGTLYFKEYSKDKVRIAADVAQIVTIVDGKSVYYLKTEEITNKLSNFINIDIAAGDTFMGEIIDKVILDQLRTALDDEKNAVKHKIYNLYYWSQTGATQVASDVVYTSFGYSLASSSKTPVVVYQKYGKSGGSSSKLSEILSDSFFFYVSTVIDDIKSKTATLRSISKDVYVAVGEKEGVIECDDAYGWTVSEDGTVCFLDDYDSEKKYGVLMSASVSEGSITKPVRIDDDVVSIRLGNKNKNVYYFKDVKDGIGNLYLNGKGIAYDVHTASLYNFKGSDALLYYTDYSAKNKNGTLCILKGGTQTKIAYEASVFAPIDEKNIAYLTDYDNSKQRGELMLYSNGTKPVLVDSDVTVLLWNAKMIDGDLLNGEWLYGDWITELGGE